MLVSDHNKKTGLDVGMQTVTEAKHVEEVPQERMEVKRKQDQKPKNGNRERVTREV